MSAARLDAVLERIREARARRRYKLRVPSKVLDAILRDAAVALEECKAAIVRLEAAEVWSDEEQTERRRRTG